MNLTAHQHELVAAGLARVYRGRLIPIIRGASGEDDEPLFTPIPEDLSALTAAELQTLADAVAAELSEVAAAPAEFVAEDFTADDLIAAATEARAGLNRVRDALAASETPDDDDTDAPAPPPDGDAEAAAEASVDLNAALAELAADPAPAPAATAAVATVEQAAVAAATDPAPVVEGTATLVAAAPLPTPAPTPRRAAAAAPVAVQIPRVSLTAATGSYSGVELGTPIPTDGRTLGDMLLSRHALFGGPSGERHPVAKARWVDTYPEERRLGGDGAKNAALIAAVTDPDLIKGEMMSRRQSLTAAGGWCAPPTPYYDLVSYGTTARPVRDSLPGFDASRGGILHGRPASLSSINDAIGIITAADDAAGGTFAAKSCQVPDCPDFVTVQSNAVYHCLQFGNMLSRAYPELVNQWTDLTMTALARLAESYLLTRIDSLSTQVTATGDLGAVAELIPQIVVAAVAMRNRHRMDSDQVLRVLIPEWTLPMLVTDVIKSQFQRFDTDQAKITALLRSFNVEPTFYKDTASGRGQVFGAQSAGVLLPFPTVVSWYLYPEGSFIYLDSGTLEIGLVRDSVLNAQNDFQIFGEFFENVAFVGVESLSVDSTVCATGVVAAPADADCPTNA